MNLFQVIIKTAGISKLLIPDKFYYALKRLKQLGDNELVINKIKKELVKLVSNTKSTNYRPGAHADLLKRKYTNF